MRLATLVAVLVGLLALASGYIHKKDYFKNADKEFLLKQQTILDVLRFVNQVDTESKFYKDGTSWKFEDNLDKYLKPEAVQEFLSVYKHDYVRTDDIFSVFNDRHREFAVALFHVFYYAKDWDTFYNTMVWAKYHVNTDAFVYSFTVAFVHHKELIGMELPAIYEIFPHYFFNSDVIEKAQKLRTGGFENCKKVDGRCEFVVRSDYTNNFYTNSLWKEEKPRKHFDFSVKSKDFVNNMFNHEDHTVSYFTEDIGLNTYFYYFHVDYPYWLGGKDINLKHDRRGELYLFEHQQLLARYYMERLSNHLGRIPEFNYEHPVEVGYNSKLRYYNGLFFPPRANEFNFNNKYNYYNLQELEDYERRVRDAIDNGYVMLPDKTIIDLTKPESIEYLGNFIQGNPDWEHSKVYKYIEIYARMFLSGNFGTSHYNYLPGVLEHFETALRDPLFYMIHKRLIRYYWKFYDNLPRYTFDELYFKGVKVEGVEMNKLITYFDHVDTDITNSVAYDYAHKDGGDFVFKARQFRLNHLPFSFKLKVNSEIEAKSVVRVFLGPKYDEYGNLFDINEMRQNFWLLDTFQQNLKSGQNVIERNSQDFTWFVRDRTPYYELYKWVMNSYNGVTEFPLDMTEAHCGFPQRLMLPKGTRDGMAFQFYFIVSPYYPPEIEQYSNFESYYSCGVASGARHVDKLPFNYPFDRYIDDKVWYTPNMYFYDTVIYHKLEKDINNIPKNF